MKYTIYGVLVLLASSYAGYRGLSFASVDEVKGVPKSVRQNPGSYRTFYGNFARYRGGK